MSKGAYQVFVRIERGTPSKTAAGSKAYAYATQAGQVDVPAFGPFTRTKREGSRGRFESMPGIETIRERFFEFRKPFPDIAVDDHIIANGVTWLVLLDPRVYARTMQVDVEVVK